MSFRYPLVLAALGLFACKRPVLAAADSDGATPPTTVEDAGAPATAREERPIATEPAPSGPASGEPEARKRVLANLLSGSYRANELPEAATDPGRRFDSGLRRRLTEVDVDAGPRADVQIAQATPSIPIGNIDRVVAGLRPRFRQCYQTALGARPSSAGSLLLTFVVDDKGEVTSSKAAPNAGLSEAMIDCVTGVVRRAVFDPPQRASTVNVRVAFSTVK